MFSCTSWSTELADTRPFLEFIYEYKCPWKRAWPLVQNYCYSFSSMPKRVGDMSFLTFETILHAFTNTSGLTTQVHWQWSVAHETWYEAMIGDFIGFLRDARLRYQQRLASWNEQNDHSGRKGDIGHTANVFRDRRKTKDYHFKKTWKKLLSISSFTNFGLRRFPSSTLHDLSRDSWWNPGWSRLDMHDKTSINSMQRTQCCLHNNWWNIFLQPAAVMSSM